MSPFDVLEHTADIGLRATGASLEEAFGAAGEGLAVLLGAWFPGGGEERAVGVGGASDVEDLLALWLDELLFVHEHDGVVFTSIRVDAIRDDAFSATLGLEPIGERELEGIGIKATTYHGLRVEEDESGGWILEAYLDV